MSKKVLSVVLALVFVLSTFAVTAFATSADYAWEPDANAKTQNWSLGDPVPGVNADEYNVDVKLQTNYTVSGIQFILEESVPEAAELINVVVNAEAFPNYGMELTVNKATGEVVIVPQVTEGSNVEAVTLASPTVIATATYKLVGETTDISIKNDPKTQNNVDGTLIAIRVDSGDVNVPNKLTDKTYAGQKATVGAAVTLGKAAVAEPELVVKAAHAGEGIVIDNSKTFGGVIKGQQIDGAIYGFKTAGQGQLAENFYTDRLESSTGTEVAVVKSYIPIFGYKFGTGTMIELKREDGTVAKRYVVVIFGDIDADGVVDNNDLSLVLSKVNKDPVEMDDVRIMAANIFTKLFMETASDLYDVTNDDLSTLLAEVGSAGTGIPTDLAQHHFKFNEFYQ